MKLPPGARPERLWAAAPAALAALRRSGREAAVEELDRLAARDPSRPEPAALKAELLRRGAGSRPGEALESARRALELSGGADWARGVLARALAGAGLPDDAERALPATATAAWLRAERALLLLARGDTKAGTAEARAARRADPLDPDAALALAAALARAGDYAECLACLPAARRARKGPPASLPGAPWPDPDELEAEVLSLLGRVEDSARARRKKALGPWPLPAGTAERAALLEGLRALCRRRPRDAWAWAWLGEALGRDGREAEGVGCLERAARLPGAPARAKLWLAAALARAGRADAALSAARAAARDRACRGEAESLSGALLASLGRGPAAVAAFRRAVSAGADRPDARASLAEVLLALGRADEARVELDKALEERPGHDRAAALRAGLRAAVGNAEGAAHDRARVVRSPSSAARGPENDYGPGEGPPQPGRGAALVDPRVELAGLLQRALEGAAVPAFFEAGAPEAAAYAREACARFAPRIPRATLEDFRRVAAARGNAAFPWFGITQMLMSVSPPPALRPVRRAWRDAADLRLLEGLKSFAADSGFWSYLRARRPAFARLVRPLAGAVAREDYAGAVGRYAGRRPDAYYHVVVSPLLRGVDIRAILLGDDGARGARTLLCPSTSPEALRAALTPDRDFLHWSGWHELLHPLLDPWTGLHEAEVRAFEGVYARVPRSARRKDWFDCFSEHLVRAATQRMIAGRFGEPAGARLAAMDDKEGYGFARALAGELRSYEEDRARYPSLLDFLPRWIAAWKDYA